MKKILPYIFMTALLIISCSRGSMDNPFLSEFTAPHGVPPFDKIKTEHYMPAFIEGMKQQSAEIEAIVNNPDLPTFKNTVEAYEYSGELLSRSRRIFNNLTSAHTSAELQTIARESSPLISKHNDDIMLNEKLFARIESVYDQRDELDLEPEQRRLLEITYRDFVRGGANLAPEIQQRFREINENLSLLSLQFGDNLLAETNAFTLVVDNEAELSGLPPSLIESAAAAARTAGMVGKWVFTLHNPSILPFLQYADNRKLREKILSAYINRGNNENENDNKDIIKQLITLRIERANLLGYSSHADFVLENNMATNPENVYNLLNRLWAAALPNAKAEAHELQRMIDREERKFKLEPWDWRYYAEKVRKEKFDLDEEMLRPYFELGNVKQGVFTLANKLFGLQFVERTDLPTYHEEVISYEVREADGTFIGILYLDFHPRESKRGGAWMNAFRQQMRKDGEPVHPIITIVCNFSRPVGDMPALLTYDEATTFFHEFGHALHGLLSDCTYARLSGTSVPRDFVELPSQIMENWVPEPEVLELFARHYQTGERIPLDLVDKLNRSQLFNQGFATTEYLAAAFLDMDWHTLREAADIAVESFEATSLKKIGLIPEIVVRYRSMYFSHIFSGGYSAGYYSYIWAEVLDADAYQAFKETSLFDRKIALAYRQNILERGYTEDPMTLYTRFRGKEPSIDPLLVRRGLK
jgi:peptidyl-dipeptidase Dcp